ncbi:MAG: GNAT family N-acetyltransferase [Aureispira sp.]|nr:GNAT family N-acetyltransferase [Aureispira sp.]
MSKIEWQLKHFDELNPKEVYELGALRQEVFVVEQDCPYLDFDRLDYECWHLLGWDENQDLVAYVRIVPQGLTYPNEVSIGRVLTSQKVRGQKLGRVLMKKSIEACQELFGKTNIRISAQTYLLDFYNSLQFVSTGKEYLEDGIPHTEMLYKYQSV